MPEERDHRLFFKASAAGGNLRTKHFRIPKAQVILPKN